MSDRWGLRGDNRGDDLDARPGAQRWRRVTRGCPSPSEAAEGGEGAGGEGAGERERAERVRRPFDLCRFLAEEVGHPVGEVLAMSMGLGCAGLVAFLMTSLMR